MDVAERIKNNKRITELENKIRRLDHFHHDSVEDYRMGDDVDLKEIHRSIRRTDKMRAELAELNKQVSEGNYKHISKFSRKGSRATFVLEKFRSEFDDLAKRINKECREVSMGYVKLSGIGIHNGLLEDILKH